MICALMIGRSGSRGLPKKNTKKVCGRYLCEYSLIAAKNSKYIDRIFISTNDPIIMKIGQKYGKQYDEPCTKYRTQYTT